MTRMRTSSRLAAAAVLTLGLGAAGLPITGAIAPAVASARAAGDCAVPFPIAELTAGQAVTGLTVHQGTSPSSFSGTVVGVLKDAIAPGLDVVLARLSSPEIDRVGGIWKGMSGSPVYAADGRLIGAVAYGFTSGPTKVAGITPYAAMDDYLAAGLTARRLARVGMEPLEIPIGVSGVSARQLSQLKRNGHFVPDNAYRMGSIVTSANAPTPETIVAGGNLAVTLSYGDVTMGGVGTATSVCNGRVVGFGHPLNFAGATTEGLHPAEAVYVQEDAVAPPFKLANLGPIAGTITQDRQTGVTGTLGVLPRTIPVTSTLTFGLRSRTGATQVVLPSALGDVIYGQVSVNHGLVVDGTMPGTELESWTITGRGPTGSPFTTSTTNRYLSTYDITNEVSWPISEQVWQLLQVPGVSVDSVHITGTVAADTGSYTVRSLEQRLGGRWVTVNHTTPIRATAGKSVVLRVVLSGPARTVTRQRVELRIPAAAAGTRGRVYVAGGQEGGLGVEEPSDARSLRNDNNTLRGVLRQFRELVRNDMIQVALELSTGVTPEPTEPAPHLLRSGPKVKLFGPLDRVVTGSKGVKIIVS